VAATNRCLARSNKSRTGFPATNKETGSAAQFLWRCQQTGSPLRGLSAAVFTALWQREFERKLNMGWRHPDLRMGGGIGRQRAAMADHLNRVGPA
jgi:hypothetical protein